MRTSRTYWILPLLLAWVSAAAADPLAYKSVPGASPVPVTQGAGLKSKQDLEAFVDGVMAAHLKQNHLAGATVAVVKDGALFFAKGYGYADLEKRIPVDAQTTLFRPGSTSKLFTWTAVMQLVEQGKLDLDADVNTYLTQFKIPKTFDAPITLRNALTHTPGFEDGALGYLFVKKAEDMAPLAEALAAHIPARVRPATTDFSDGSNASYSNYATALAGLIVANVSGMPFDDYVDKNIFGPLEMKSSSFRQPLPAKLAANMATGYTFKNGAWEAYKHGFELVQFTPAGSLSATATDMAKFMLAHLNRGAYNGRRILREETARLMHSRQFSPNPHVNGSGLGFYETWVNGRRMIGHGGDMLNFHTDMSLLPEAGIGIFVSYNTTHEAGTSIARRDLVRGFMDRYYPATLPQITPPADFKERAAKYAGSYSVNRHSYSTIEKLSGLGGAIKVVPTEDNTLMIVAGGEASQVVEVAPNLFRLVDNQDIYAFIEDAKGRITHAVIPFAFIGAYKLAWHQKPGLHWFILGFGLLCFVVAIVSALRHWKADRAGDPGARRARRLAALTGVVHLLFIALLVAIVSAGLEELVFGLPWSVNIALILPLLAIPLTLGVLYFAFRAWREQFWTRYARIQYSVIALAAAAFLWSLNHWNLVGHNFG